MTVTGCLRRSRSITEEQGVVLWLVVPVRASRLRPRAGAPAASCSYGGCCPGADTLADRAHLQAAGSFGNASQQMAFGTRPSLLKTAVHGLWGVHLIVGLSGVKPLRTQMPASLYTARPTRRPGKSF